MSYEMFLDCYVNGTSIVDDPDHIVIPKPLQMPVSQPLFPSCLCSVVPMIIRLTEDSEVNADGIAGSV